MKKENRIKKNEEIAKIVLNKQKIKSEFFFIYYQKSDTIFKAAISVSKKLGNSVKRNHAKRIIRELIRPNIKLVMPMKIVVVVKKDLFGIDFSELQKEMNLCLLKIEKKLNNN